MKYEVLSPIDGQAIQSVETTNAKQIDSFVAAAHKAQRAWRKVHPTRRGEILFGIAEVIESRLEEIAELESRNTGKLLLDTRREVSRAAGTFRYYAGWADKSLGETIPMGDQYLNYTVATPHGVVTSVIPWNVPFFFAAKKIAPAIAFGNACLLKPAEETPLTALILDEIVKEADIPEGLVEVIVGGREVGEALVSHPDVELIVFTGSDATGVSIATSAAKNITPVALELGGKSPQIVFDDADLEVAADAIVLGVFASSGQMCIAGSRLLAEESIYDDLIAKVTDRVEKLRVGDPFNSETDLGPQITAAQRDKTLARR